MFKYTRSGLRNFQFVYFLSTALYKNLFREQKQFVKNGNLDFGVK